MRVSVRAMEAVLVILRKAIKDKGMTQTDLGTQIYRSQTWVSHHLDGSYVLSLDDYLRLCAGLGINPVTTLAKALNK